MSTGKQLPLVHLSTLFFISLLAGWLLSDYNAHRLTWIGTAIVTLHLAWVGFDAIALAVAWSVGIVWAGAIAYAWPRTVHGAGIEVWAGALAASWVLAITLALILAFAQRAMESINLRKVRAFWVVVIITWIGLGMGQIANSWLISG